MTIAMSSAESSRRPAGNGAASGYQPLAAASVSCRHCQGSNPGSRKFCGHCGKSLWEPCPKCGAEGPATETFCGACGANVLAAYQERALRFEADLARVQGFHEAADFGQALDVLGLLTRSNPLRLETQVQRARELFDSLTAQRDRRIAESAGVLAKARELHATHAYETALAMLEEVPQPLRSEEFTAFHGQVQSQWKEVVSLGGEIRQALEEKRTLELLPKLERLIQLQPNHTQAKALAEQLRDRHVQAAKKKLACHQYDDALALVRQIPALVRTSEVEDLQVRAAELSWLLCDLSTAPLVDKPLLAVAERLLKFAPTNKQAASLQTQLQVRARSKPKDPRFALPLWAAPPEKTRLGLPLDWLGGFGNLAGNEETTAQLAKHPGCLFVAAGLALQGMEKSAVRVNLAPPQPETSMFGGLGLLRKKKKPVRAAWGLDLTETGLKAIKLACDERGEKLTIEACEVIEHKKNLNQPGLENERSALFAATLQTFLARHDLGGCKVCASLQGAQLLGRFLELPPLPKKQIPGVVEYEARRQIPIPLSELVWDYQVLSEAEDAYNELRQHQVLLLAAREYYVQDRLTLFKHAEISIDALQSDAVALHNLLTSRPA